MSHAKFQAYSFIKEAVKSGQLNGLFSYGNLINAAKCGP